jgi:transposase
MSKRKHLTPQQKVIILRELLENQVPISQLAEKYQIHTNDIYNWKKKHFEQVEDAFSSKQKPNIAKQDEKQQKLELKLKQKNEIIAELV